MKRDAEHWVEVRQQIFPGYEGAIFQTKSESGNFVPLPKVFAWFASVLEPAPFRLLVAITCSMEGPSMLTEVDLAELTRQVGLSRVSNLMPHLRKLEDMNFIVTKEAGGVKKLFVLLLHPWLAAKWLVEKGYFKAGQLNSLNEMLMAMGWDPIVRDGDAAPMGMRRRRAWVRPAVVDPSEVPPAPPGVSLFEKIMSSK